MKGSDTWEYVVFSKGRRCTYFRKNSAGSMAKTLFCGEMREYGHMARRDKTDGESAEAQEVEEEEEKSRAGAGGGGRRSRGTAGRSFEKLERKEEQASEVVKSTATMRSPPPSTLPSPASPFGECWSFNSLLLSSTF